MMQLVTGGSASGKSGYAENRVLSFHLSRNIYIATMQPWDEECRQKIKKHREMRKEKNFETIECYTGLEALSIRGEKPVVLLECMSNLAANECFSHSGEARETGGTCMDDGKAVISRIMNGIRSLKRQSAHLIVVTNEVFSDDVTYDLQTNQYRMVLGCINQELAAMADVVTEVVYGLPQNIKE